jgi:hypothetical protein
MSLSYATDSLNGHKCQLTAANVFPFKRLPILPLLPISNGSWMYVIIPCITGISKPNEWLYQNDRLHYVYAVNVFIAFVFAVFPQMWLDYIQLFQNYLLRAFCFILCTNKIHLVRVLMVITLFWHVLAWWCHCQEVHIKLKIKWNAFIKFKAFGTFCY